MPRPFPHCFLVLLFLLILSPAVSAQVEPREENAAITLLEDVASKSRSIRLLHTAFVQEKQNPNLTFPLLSQGFLCLARKARTSETFAEPIPDLLWAYVSPKASGFMCRHGEKSILQSDGVVRPLARGEEAVTAAITSLLTLWIEPNVRQVSSHFEMTRPFTGKATLRLRPRQRQFFSGMEVTFDPDTGTVNDVLFEEGEGATLRLIFTGTTVNQPLPGHCLPLSQ